jgi:hypothetical protein
VGVAVSVSGGVSVAVGVAVKLGSGGGVGVRLASVGVLLGGALGERVTPRVGDGVGPGGSNSMSAMLMIPSPFASNERSGCGENSARMRSSCVPITAATIVVTVAARKSARSAIRRETRLIRDQSAAKLKMVATSPTNG